MNTKTLLEAGLSESQAKAYVALIQQGQLSPPQLAEQIKESRTNSYMILERLEELGLVKKNERQKKLVYEPENPVALERLIENRRNEILQTEKELKNSLPTLLNYFYTYQNKPGVKFFEGKDGIYKMYQDQLRVRKDVYFIRSEGDINLLGDRLYKIIEKRHELGITIHGIEEGTEKLMKYSRENDERLGRDMNFFPLGAYTEPVNLYTYGDKTAIISFGKETIGILIESPQIAAAMRQLFAFLQLGAQTMMHSAQPENSVE